MKDSERQESYGWNTGPAQTLLAALAGLYSHAERHADVLALFDQAPYWGAKDILQLNRGNYFSGGYSRGMRGHGSETVSLYSILGKALLATGRKAEAQKVVDAMLESEPGLDRGYELLLASGGVNVLERLDQLFAQDQFEERPLIWKAEMLRRQNKLEEAEQVARRAISIDPSDGEQGRGDRMRVYSVLADIREGRGDKKEAEFFRGVVKAIRLSENADQYYAAGLLKRAIQMYEDSLKHFADAYCIQSRMAVQLAEMGLHEQAERTTGGHTN